MTATFRKETDELLEGISHEKLASALGCSIASVRQARLAIDAKAYRNPPQGWERVIARLAEHESARLGRLAKRLRAKE
jgi:hypothetical protein